ncbi:hypothetical protein ACFXTH_013752 [Malus domestica]
MWRGRLGWEPETPRRRHPERRFEGQSSDCGGDEGGYERGGDGCGEGGWDGSRRLLGGATLSADPKARAVTAVATRVDTNEGEMDAAGEVGMGAGDFWEAPMAERTAKRTAMRATTEDAFETAIVDRVWTSLFGNLKGQGKLLVRESRVLEDSERLKAQSGRKLDLRSNFELGFFVGSGGQVGQLPVRNRLANCYWFGSTAHIA